MVDGGLGLGGDGEQCLGVLAEDPEPVREVGGMVVTRRGGDGEMGAGDGGAELGDEFLGGVRVVAEAAGEVTPETGPVAGPVDELVACGAVEGRAFGEVRGGG